MNWLNRLDDVLDKALTPQNSRHGNSSSPSRSQQGVSIEHVVEHLGEKSDSSQDSQETSRSRSLDVNGSSIPGRVRRRSKGAAKPASGKTLQPALKNAPRPAQPGKLKRNLIKEESKQLGQYPGNIKRRMPQISDDEEERETLNVEFTSSEVFSSVAVQSMPMNTNDIEPAKNELRRGDTMILGYSSTFIKPTTHDDKQRRIEIENTIEDEVGDKDLKKDSDVTSSTIIHHIEAIDSLIDMKKTEDVQSQAVSHNSVEKDLRVIDPITDSKSRIDEDAKLQIDTANQNTNIAPSTAGHAKSENYDRQPHMRDEERKRHGGIVVTLFPEESYDSSDAAQHRDISSNLSSDALPSSIDEQNQSSVDMTENAVIGETDFAPELLANHVALNQVVDNAKDESCTIVQDLESRHCLPEVIGESTQLAEQSHHINVPACVKAIVSTQPKTKTGKDELPSEKGEQLRNEIVSHEYSISHNTTVSVPGYPIYAEVGVHDAQNHESKAQDDVSDSFSIAKLLVTQHQTLRERDESFAQRSINVTKNSADIDSTVSIWSNYKVDVPFDRRKNCHGTVKLRLLRARRLSCSIGSFVKGIISLKPWKGKVRTKNARAYAGTKRSHGVCALWDDCEENQVSMIHAFSSDESPIPTIEIELTVSPLGMGMIGLSMVTLSLSCEDLIMNPFRSHRQWLTIPLSEHNIMDAELASPMLQVEAMFEPTIVEEVVAREDSILPPESIDIPKELLYREDYPSTPEHKRVKEGSRFDELTCLTPVSDKSPPFSAKSQRSAHSQTKQHLLCLKKFRLPATCCVCSKSLMSGIRNRPAYRCEKCKIDCCEDCILQIDIKVPCESLLSQDVVKNAIQNKLSMDLILNAVAPVNRNITLAGRESQLSLPTINKNVSNGIGVLSLVFLRTFVLDDPWSPESDATDILADEKTSFKPGNYYMRITRLGSKDTARSQTIQNSSKPVFDSEELKLTVPHYGSEFRIDLVDATTEKAIGSSLLTIQSILQLQRDKFFDDNPLSVISYLRRTGKMKDKIRLRIDLRHDMKDVTPIDFYSPPNPSPHSSSLQKGDIVGYTDILINVFEDFSQLYGDNPYKCPARPPDELNMRLFQLHLTRLTNIIVALKDSVNAYIYLISWKNPLVTGLAFFISLQICATFDPAYLGSLPCFFVIVLMMYSAVRRFFVLSMRDSYVQREIEKRRKEENVELEHAIHRPVGRIGISICGGRNIASLEFGLPGSVSCRILWKSEGLNSCTDSATGESRPLVHEIGSTDRVYSTNPVWKEAKESSLTKRLRSVQHFNQHISEETRLADSPQFLFPILQPFSTHDTGLPVLEPWESSTCTIDVEVGFTDVISILPDSESTVGIVSIPFVELYKQKEIEGWFKINQPGRDNRFYNPITSDDGTSQLSIKMWWTPPVEEHDTDVDVNTCREESVFIQEEMMRSAIIHSETRLGVLGSSLGAINSVRGLTGHLSMVQNGLGQVLDTIEMICNALSFTDPLKSAVLFGIVVGLWIFFSLVSMKVIIYALILVQYVATFVGRFGYLFSRRETCQANKGSPYGIWILNAYRGIPTFEDLRRTYFWESLRRGVREAEQFSEEKRGKRLKMLFRAQWYSSIQILSGDRWRASFAIIQGHRFIWWSSVNDFDEGRKPLGSLFLSGHAGLATPSPLDLKQVPNENLDRLVCLFGKGMEKQERISVLTPSSAEKEELESAINHTMSHKAE